MVRRSRRGARGALGALGANAAGVVVMFTIGRGAHVIAEPTALRDDGVGAAPTVAPDVAPPAAPTAPPRDGSTRLEITVPGTTVTFALVRVPAGHAPPPVDGAAAEELTAFWIAEHETTWDLYDIFVYGLDTPEGAATATGADAVSRPSKPYVPPDRGFGHAGYPALGMTHLAATEFCAWLSAKTGRRFRLPTEAEWEFACRGATGAPYAGGTEVAQLAEVAWTAENAGRTTHPVGRLRATDGGLYDLHGNVAEWTNGRDGAPVAKGGSYRDDAAAAQITARQKQRSNWNASDPQIPKSRWWLADCSWVGFRLVMEDEPAAPAP